MFLNPPKEVIDWLKSMDEPFMVIKRDGLIFAYTGDDVNYLLTVLQKRRYPERIWGIPHETSPIVAIWSPEPKVPWMLRFRLHLKRFGEILDRWRWFPAYMIHKLRHR